MAKHRRMSSKMKISKSTDILRNASIERSD